MPAAAPVWQRIALVATAVVAGVMLLYSSAVGVRSGYHFSTGREVRGPSTQARQFSCLERYLDRELPNETTVFLRDHNDLWAQRVAELGYPRLRPVAKRSAAQAVVIVRPVSHSRGVCPGLVVRIRR